MKNEEGGNIIPYCLQSPCTRIHIQLLIRKSGLFRFLPSHKKAWPARRGAGDRRIVVDPSEIGRWHWDWFTALPVPTLRHPPLVYCALTSCLFAYDLTSVPER